MKRHCPHVAVFALEARALIFIQQLLSEVFIVARM